MDDARFDRLYEAYGTGVLRYCLFRLDSRADAEDAAAESFARLLAGGDHLGDERVERWLIKVASRLCTDCQRRVSRETPAVASFDPALTVPDATSAWVDPHVRAAVGRLTAGQQRVVFLRIVEDRSFSDVARLCGLTEPAARMTWHRAIRSLGRRLAGGAG